MTHARPVGTKIPTKIPQPARRPDTSARVHGAILGSATRRVAARSSAGEGALATRRNTTFTGSYGDDATRQSPVNTTTSGAAVQRPER